MLQLVELRPQEDWDSLAEPFSPLSVFHRRVWLDLITALAQATFRPVAIECQGQLVGLVPLFQFRRGPLRILASPPPQAATPYLGPVVDHSLLPEVFLALRRFAKERRVAYMELRLAHDLPANLWAPAGFERQERATHVLPLHPDPQQLWQHALDPACRRAVRKAEREGVQIHEVRLGDIAPRYYELARMVFARHRRLPPLHEDDYLRIARAIEEGARVRVLAAVHGGSIIAAGIFPFDEQRVYYLDGVSDRAAQAVRPNNLLHWEVIRWACEQGLQEYDMVGAGIPGVARFKQTFGASERPYTYVFFHGNFLSRLARRLYASAIEPWRALQLRWRSGALTREAKGAEPD